MRFSFFKQALRIGSATFQNGTATIASAAANNWNGAISTANALFAPNFNF
jgi:hypothetical protein